jgi:hypothetical protein
MQTVILALSLLFAWTPDGGFQLCMTSPGWAPPVDWCSLCYDRDLDGDVDLHDWHLCLDVADDQGCPCLED